MKYRVKKINEKMYQVQRRILFVWTKVKEYQSPNKAKWYIENRCK